MARLVRHFVEDARPCSYLPNANAALEYRLMLEVSPHELEMMLQRGWRRFGPAYFRPSCNLCSECQSIRIDVDSFEPSRSQRRALKRALRFRIAVSEPRVDAQRLALHARWHANREERRQWESTNLTEDEYATQFASPSHTGREVAWYDGEELVALGLVDLTPRSVSAAYFFYDPRIAASSPGIGNVMHCVELARELGARYVYLGYMVEGCRSLAYKSNFRPQERLVGRPSMSMEPIWRALP